MECLALAFLSFPGNKFLHLSSTLLHRHRHRPRHWSLASLIRIINRYIDVVVDEMEVERHSKRTFLIRSICNDPSGGQSDGLVG